MSTMEIMKMSRGEKLTAMEQLWDALCRDGAEPGSPAWHESVLAARKERLDSPDSRFLTLEQVRERFR